MLTFIRTGESIHWKPVKARIRIYSFVSAIIARRPASEFLAALGMVKAISWDGWTDGPVYEKWAMFCRTQVYKQEGNSCTWQPWDRTQTHASQARLSPHDPSHSPWSIPHSRPSLFEIQPAGRTLAQNNRNCGEISVPLGLSLVDYCGASKSDEAPRRAGTLLCTAEFSLFSIALASSRNGLTFLRSFQFHCTLMPIARGTRCHGSTPLTYRLLACYRPWTFIYDVRRIRCGTLG